MRKSWWWIPILLTVLLACQTPAPTPGAVSTTAAPVTDTAAAPVLAPSSAPAETREAAGTEMAEPSPVPIPSVAPTAEQTPGAAPVGTGGAVRLQPLRVDWSKPFGAGELASGQAQSYLGVDYALPIDLSQLANPEVIAGLTEEQRSFLAQNGFVIIHSQEAQFKDIRDSVSKFHGQPYFLTLDAAYHAVHLTFDELLKALEREQLQPRMAAITRAVLDEVLSYQDITRGTTIESEVQLSAAYLSVALKLFEPDAEIDPWVDALASRQIAQIMEGAGREASVLIPGFEDDYGAYKPVGHYAGDPALEQYFRGMTWFGRVHFSLTPREPGTSPSRAPLIITLALRRAQMEAQAASEGWSTVHEVLTFLIGPTDDAGPIEYAALMDRVYGESAAPEVLADDALWQLFLSLGQELPAPQINSTFVDWVTTDMEEERGWRFLGQRFTLDGFVFQNLVFDKVSELGGPLRLFPTGLDVMAAMGSELAWDTLEALGETDYVNYPEQMAKMQEAISAQPDAEWLSRFYDGWLYSFFPVLASRESGFPAYMGTRAWAFKDLNAALGSWAELKHDTILYTKMPEAAGGGGPPSSGPAPGYVELNPEAFYRLAVMTQVLHNGLNQRGLLGSGGGGTLGLSSMGYELNRLSDRLAHLGDIAGKELRGEALDEDDLQSIQGCLGMIECWSAYERSGTEKELPPVPVVAAVAGGGEMDDRVLEVGVGYVDRIYVIVPVEGRMQVAQGGVFSYYEFLQDRSNRLTDQEWQEALAGDPGPPLPPWSAAWVLEGGDPADWLAFRVNDWYIVTEEGADLNQRESPSLGGAILRQLGAGEYLLIENGPVQADGHTWWQVVTNPWSDPISGWVVEDQAWFERAWGQ